MGKPNIILFDIETTAIQGHTWGLYDTNVIHIENDWKLLSFAYKQLGDTATRCKTRADYKDRTDKALTKDLYKVLNSADILVGHNLDSFDVKKAKAKFIEHGLNPTSKYRTVDTLKIARSQFKFTSNKLNDLGKLLGLGEKEKTGGYDLWLDCMKGDKRAFKKLANYNKRDVSLLEDVYLKLRGWFPNHPKLAEFTNDWGSCPTCGGHDLFKSGIRYSQKGASQLLGCKGCLSFHRQKLDKKTK